MADPKPPMIGYSALTGTTYVFMRNGQKRPVPEGEVVSLIVAFLDDRDLTVTRADGTRVKYVTVDAEACAFGAGNEAAQPCHRCGPCLEIGREDDAAFDAAPVDTEAGNG